jgi:hypothetical protein
MADAARRSSAIAVLPPTRDRYVSRALGDTADGGGTPSLLFALKHVDR